MTSTSEYRALLAKDGRFRKWMAEASGQQSWADQFCDELLIRLIQPTEHVRIHLWESLSGTFQVNIDIGNKGAYTHDVTSDPLKIIGERLGQQLVCSSDPSEE